MMKKKAYCYKINLHFLFLNAICHKGEKFLEILKTLYSDGIWKSVYFLNW